MPDMGGGWAELSLVLGVAVEAIALLLILVVLRERKEPPSTVAWILALIFLPGIGATLYLMFGRSRVRLPAQWKREADRRLAGRKGARAAREAARAGLRKAPEPPASSVRGAAALAHAVAPLASATHPMERELFHVGAALAGALPTAGNSVELLVDGDPTYAAIGAAIDAAQHHVHAEYYLVRNDATAAWLRDRLAAAAERGADVKLLVDGYGSFWLRRRFVRSLRAAGVRVAFFLPARLLLLQPMNLRNHRKIVVVDGKVGFTGGINVGDEYRGGRTGEPLAGEGEKGAGEPPRAPSAWRDTHLRVEGPSAAELARIFEQDWHFATGEDIPHVGAEGEPAAPSSPPLSRDVAVEGGHPEAAAPPDAVVAVVRSGPDIHERETIHRMFFAAITLARSRVYITTPYFIPDRSIVVALQTAALRGVDVRLLLPSRSNHKVVWMAGRSFYEELLVAGVRIYEYGPGMIHAKTMVVDGSVALVGSANMDMRSFRLNFEVHAVVRDKITALRLEGCFEADLTASHRIEPAAFARRSNAQRVLEGAARLLSPLM